MAGPDFFVGCASNSGHFWPDMQWRQLARSAKVVRKPLAAGVAGIGRSTFARMHPCPYSQIRAVLVHPKKQLLRANMPIFSAWAFAKQFATYFPGGHLHACDATETRLSPRSSCPKVGQR